MRQRIESEAMLPREAPKTVQSKPLTAENMSAQDAETELAELKACVDACVARIKGHFITFQKTIMKRTLALHLPLFVIMVASLFAMYRGRLSPNAMIWVVMISMLLTQLFSLMITRLRPNAYPGPTEQERLAAQRLAEREDVRVVNSLIDYLRWGGDHTVPDRTVRLELWKALGRLLPSLTAEQARELGSERQGILAEWLQGWEQSIHHSLYVAIGNQPAIGILHVFAQIGQDYLRTCQQPHKMNVLLRNWADGRKLGQDPAIRQAAARCCEAIKNKSALIHPDEQLLRASAPPPTSQENLLRPVQGVRQTDPQELLRSTSINKLNDDRIESDTK